MKTTMKTKPQVTIDTPKDIKKTDLERPSYKAKDGLAYDVPGTDSGTFQLWYTERFGWCIPTLLIRSARRGSGRTDRTYAVSLKGELVTVGLGPHVLRQVTVHVRRSRVKALQHYIDLRVEGQGKAGDTRDRISTRRAQTQARRDPFGFLF